MTENRSIVEKAEPEPKPKQEAEPEPGHRWVQRKDRTAFQQHSGRFPIQVQKDSKGEEK
tara:strand:+ start:303 stop:479 length:177 start_codon:yes stop_codon:yes gene_type:complete